MSAAPFLLSGLNGPVNAIAHIAGRFAELFQGLAPVRRFIALIELGQLRGLGRLAVNPKTTAKHIADALGVYPVGLPVEVDVAAFVVGLGITDFGSQGRKYLQLPVAGINGKAEMCFIISGRRRHTWTTKLGTRTYQVVSVEKVLETDTSSTTSTSGNRITLYTCVRDQRDYRWCVTAVVK